MIENQVELPLGVAIGVATQGMRVRFGRSLVTVVGVLLGIAFLMAILTGQVIKAGVADEQARRNEVHRMERLLTAEIGAITQRTIGIIQVGPLSTHERRFIEAIQDAEPARLSYYSTGQVDQILRDAGATQATIATVGKDASVVLVLGEGTTQNVDMTSALGEARYKLVCATRKGHSVQETQGIHAVILERELRQDELDQQELADRRATFRNIWIVVISMLVTVMGITNSMLMSVTERFREIGTMKCLGALSTFVRQLFLIESSIIGMVGAFFGALTGTVFSIAVYALTYGLELVIFSMSWGRLAMYFALAVLAGVVLAVIAALYPAKFASRMLPAHALRSSI